jgi:diaminopimelate decarboxylase
MDWFAYRDGQLYCEDVNVDEIAASVGTPVYVYSRRTLEHHYRTIAEAFAPLHPLICYSIKSNGNLQIIRRLADLGSGMDVVSGGELYRAEAAGVNPAKIVYAGVGKTDDEIRRGIELGIAWFNVESEAEFENLARIAKEMDAHTQAALRVNPDVDPRTHAKTTTGKKETKFGVDIERARRFFERYGRDPHVKLNALHLHIGSPVYAVDPYVDAIRKALALIEDLRAAGHRIEALDIGGGYGANYETDQSPAYQEYAGAIVPLLEPFVKDGGKVILEPGRTISCNAGVLLTRVQYIKTGGSKKFVIVDAGMNDLIRPAMYDAFHFTWPTNVAPAHVPEARRRQMPNEGLEPTDVVGPVCETADSFAKDRPLPPVARGDVMAIFAAGAYGMVMASNYNAFPRPAEVLVSGDRATLIRRRETYEELVGPERGGEEL